MALAQETQFQQHRTRDGIDATPSSRRNAVSKDLVSGLIYNTIIQSICEDLRSMYNNIAGTRIFQFIRKYTTSLKYEQTFWCRKKNGLLENLKRKWNAAAAANYASVSSHDEHS